MNWKRSYGWNELCVVLQYTSNSMLSKQGCQMRILTMFDPLFMVSLIIRTLARVRSHRHSKYRTLAQYRLCLWRFVCQTFNPEERAHLSGVFYVVHFRPASIGHITHVVYVICRPFKDAIIAVSIHWSIQFRTKSHALTHTSTHAYAHDTRWSMNILCDYHHTPTRKLLASEANTRIRFASTNMIESPSCRGSVCENSQTLRVTAIGHTVQHAYLRVHL